MSCECSQVSSLSGPQDIVCEKMAQTEVPCRVSSAGAKSFFQKQIYQGGEDAGNLVGGRHGKEGREWEIPDREDTIFPESGPTEDPTVGSEFLHKRVGCL